MRFEDYLLLKTVLEIQKKFGSSGFKRADFGRIIGPEMDKWERERVKRVSVVKKACDISPDTYFTSHTHTVKITSMCRSLEMFGYISRHRPKDLGLKGGGHAYLLCNKGKLVTEEYIRDGYKIPNMPIIRPEKENTFLVYKTRHIGRSKQYIPWEIDCTTCKHYLRCLTNPDFNKTCTLSTWQSRSEDIPNADLGSMCGTTCRLAMLFQVITRTFQLEEAKKLNNQSSIRLYQDYDRKVFVTSIDKCKLFLSKHGSAFIKSLLKAGFCTTDMQFVFNQARQSHQKLYNEQDIISRKKEESEERPYLNEPASFYTLTSQYAQLERLLCMTGVEIFDDPQTVATILLDRRKEVYLAIEDYMNKVAEETGVQYSRGMIYGQTRLSDEYVAYLEKISKGG